MFSRNETYRDVVICPVEVKLVTGETFSGVLEKPRTMDLEDFLNAESGFVKIELYDKTKRQLSKRAIVFCQEKDQPRVDQLKVEMMKTDIYNPFSVLGLEPGTNRKAVRAAYIELTRLYHPDRYQGVELPKEIAKYVLSMTQRLNIAFNEANEYLDKTARKADQAMPTAGATENAAA